jgi:DNA helicase-2/ATP-dependent DNA helicase PcrA
MAPTSWRARPSTVPQSGGGRPSRRVEAPVAREPGERFVDYEESGDVAEGIELRRGSKVVHERFGRGEVLKVVSVGEPAVVVFFPGWGEKKVLVRFLRLG